MFLDIKTKLSVPTLENKLTIFSDGNDDYTKVIYENYDINCINYGQKIKSQNGIKIIPAIKRTVYGYFENSKEIETNTVESINSVLREKVSRLNRRTKKISKRKYALDSAVCLFKFFWNFIHKRHEHLQTPAMMEAITNKFWTWGNFLHTKLSYTS